MTPCEKKLDALLRGSTLDIVMKAKRVPNELKLGMKSVRR
jgi:hypothetical protein